MGKKPSVIEINNKRYDAITGQLLGAVKAPSAPLKHPTSGQAIDGLVRSTPAAKHRLHSAKSHLKKPAAAVHQRAQRSKTLMRAAVAKPAAPKKAGHPAHPPQPSGTARNHRVSQAMNVAKNAHIRHFTSKHASPRQTTSTSRTNDISREIAGSRPGPAAAAAAITPAPGITGAISHNNLERMLDEALFRADAHKKALKGRLSYQSRLTRRFLRMPVWASIAILAVAIIAAGSYMAWRYIPQASIKLASIKADVNGSVPAYIPAGFKFAGPIAYAHGTVSLTYQAPQGKAFIIQQQASSLNSSSLAANAEPRDSQVQTSRVKGTTVYIYNSKNQATWVNNGVRYTIKDTSAKLSSGQLLKIADSL